MRDLGGIDGRRPRVSSPRNYTNARRGIACGWFHFGLREFAYVQGRRAYPPARIGPPMCCPQLSDQEARKCKRPNLAPAKRKSDAGFCMTGNAYTIQKATIYNTKGISGIAINSTDHVQIQKSVHAWEDWKIFLLEKQVVSRIVDLIYVIRIYLIKKSKIYIILYTDTSV